jgi:hypothetical protein
MRHKKNVKKINAVDPRNDQAMADLMGQVAKALGPIADRCPAFAPPHQCQPIKELAEKARATAQEFQRKADHPDPAPSCPWLPPDASSQSAPLPTASTTPPPAATPVIQPPGSTQAPADPPAPQCPCRGQASPNADDVPNASTTPEPAESEPKA